jgi:hypothetical protein
MADGSVTTSAGFITGSGVDGRVPYFDGTNSITSEAGFIYDASTNRLGVNTSVPNATIGADAALDSGYGLLIKTGASNYNGIGIAIDSTYGNLISTEKLGTASARNLTLLNQSGFVSLKENGNFGVNTLNPAVSGTGIDVYSSTSTGIRFHTATSGLTVNDGAGINFSAANNLGITNYENGTIDIVTNGNSGVFVATNGFVGINGATPSVALTVNGGASISNLTTGQVLFPTSGGTLSGTNSLFWDNATDSLRIGSNTSANRRLSIFSSSDANHFALISNAPAITLSNNFSYTYYATLGMATANNNFVAGAVQGDLVLGAFNTSSILFSNANTNTLRMSLNGSGAAIFSGSVTGRGPKSQIIADGNSVGAGILLSNSIVGVNRRNWGIFTEQDVEGDFVIKRSNSSGGSAESGTTILSLLNTGAATFSSSVTAASGKFASANGTTYAATPQLRIDGNGVNNSYAQIRFTDSALSDGKISYFPAAAAENRYFSISARETESDFVIRGSGNVGIGTSSPSSKLMLYQSTAGNVLLNIVSNQGGSTQAGINFSPSMTDGEVASNPAQASIYATDSNYGANIIFANKTTGAVGNALTERMRITSGGNVGIGTASSDIFSRGDARIVGISASGASDNMSLQLNAGASGGRGAQIYMGQGGTRHFTISSNVSESTLGTTSNTPLRFTTNDAEKMRITSGGNVLIGTTLDTGVGKLQIRDAAYEVVNSYYWLFNTGDSTRYGFNNTGVGVLILNKFGVGNVGSFNMTTGIYTPLSDINKKKDFEASIIGLKEVLQLKPTLYRMKTEDESALKELGFIAQEVKEFIPQAYVENGDEDNKFIGLNYNAIVAALVKSVQEQQAQIEELKAIVATK